MYQAQEFEIKKTDQIFSYWYKDRLLHFNASLLHRVRKAAPDCFKLFEIPLNEEIYQLCMQHRGIEEPRVDALRGKDLREPGYLVLFDERGDDIPSYTVVDGHHRIVRRYRGGLRTMSFWACWPQIWTQVLMPSTKEEDEFIATKMPERVMDDTSIVHEVTMKRE